jgi:uncharacterized membrane protein
MIVTPLRTQQNLHVLTVIFMGIMAGFFWTYSANVNLAMLQMDGPTYATVQAALNRNVRHWMFFIFFFGTPLCCALALLVAWPARAQGWWLALAVAGLAYLLGIVVFTHQVNLPLNRLTEAWNPAALPVDWRQTRDSWNDANLVRSITSCVAFIIAVFALRCRISASPDRSYY